MKTSSLPLSGITVVAVEQAVAAPFCTARLADAGARVVKVERPEGDFARGYDDVVGGQSSYFVWLNRGKESIVLDLTSDAGKETLWRLIGDADVLVQNLKPLALEKLGFGFDALRKKFPGLILCSISGYGEQGPMMMRKAYDLLIQAESGLSSITGGPNEMGRVGVSVVDIATGAAAHAAVLEALMLRQRTGEGSDIRISMFDVMADWLTVPLLHHEAGKTPQRAGLSHPSIAPYGVFKTKDDKDILISIQSDREWQKFCSILPGTDTAASDERFRTNVARVANRNATDALVQRAFAALDESAARDLLSQADIAFASVNDMGALSTHPHLRRITIDTPAGAVSLPAPAAVFVGAPRLYGPVPALGENASYSLEEDTKNATHRAAG